MPKAEGEAYAPAVVMAQPAQPVQPAQGMAAPLLAGQQTVVVMPGQPQFVREPPHCCCKLIFPVCAVYWCDTSPCCLRQLSRTLA